MSDSEAEEGGVSRHPAPVPGCECWQCVMERALAEKGRTGENIDGGPDENLFAYDESKQERREQRRNDRWLGRHGYR